jgi:methylated-DNA-[protein]-cysteine S-methyltransferase
MIVSRLFFETQLGVCGIDWSPTAVTRFRLPERRALSEPSDVPAWIEKIKERVQRHMAGDFQDFTDVPLDYARISSFQRAVYDAALTVKAGSTQTYGWLATTIGQPVAMSRAVGTALGQNPWPLLVPCHRFVSAGGKMTGFSAPGGIKTKLRLLALEGAELFAE